VAVTLSGTTRDFQTADVVDEVDIAAFGADELSIGMTTSGGSGQYTLPFAPGTGRVSFRMTDPAGNRFVDSYVLEHRLSPDAGAQTLDLISVSHLTLNALPAFIGVMRTPGRGLSGGVVVDCAGYPVDGAIATVSATPGTTEHLAGADTYYFSAGSTSLPVRHTQAADTNHDGRFVVIELPPTPDAYLQVWGYMQGQTPGVDALALLSQVRADVAGDAWIDVKMEPLRR
jgi:hypothetical protein